MDTHRPRRSPRARGANSCAALAGVESRRDSDPATIGFITATDVFGHGLVAVASFASRLAIRGDQRAGRRQSSVGQAVVSRRFGPAQWAHRVCELTDGALAAFISGRKFRPCLGLGHRSIACSRAAALLISRRETAHIAMVRQLFDHSRCHHGVRRTMRKVLRVSRSLAAVVTLEATCRASSHRSGSGVAPSTRCDLERCLRPPVPPPTGEQEPGRATR